MGKIDTEDLKMGCFLVFVLLFLVGAGFAAGFISHATGYYPSRVIIKWGEANE